MEESGSKWYEVEECIMFMGQYNHTVDTKGRLIVPAKYRESLGNDFVVTKGLDGCLFVYPNLEWEAFAAKLKELPMTKRDTRSFVRFFLSGAASVELDKQGRILLPPHLREFAGLEKDVVLIGISNRIEIWSKDKWEEEAAFDDMDDIAERMADLGVEL